LTVNTDSIEEEMNAIASNIFGRLMAVTDYTRPHERQQLRCYPDISREDPRIWIDLRMAKPKAEAMIRCSMRTSKEEGEQIASELWQMDVELQKELHEAIPAKTMLWFKRPVEQTPEDTRKPEEDEADVEEMEPRPVRKTIKRHEVSSITRAFSEDDLARFDEQEEESSSDPDMMIQWAVNVDHERTWFTARQGSTQPEILEAVARRMGVSAPCISGVAVRSFASRLSISFNSASHSVL
jgi:hypothetical protein